MKRDCATTRCDWTSMETLCKCSSISCRWPSIWKKNKLSCLSFALCYRWIGLHCIVCCYCRRRRHHPPLLLWLLVDFPFPFCFLFIFRRSFRLRPLSPSFSFFPPSGESSLLRQACAFSQKIGGCFRDLCASIWQTVRPYGSRQV